jgi:hypothetical protein
MTIHSVAVESSTSIETSIPSLTSTEATLAFQVPLRHYVGAELTDVLSDVRAHDGQLYTNDHHFRDTLFGHPADQIRAEVKDGTIRANLYSLDHPTTAQDRFEHDMQQFILIDGEVWTRCGEPAYQVLASRLGVMIEATIDLSATARPGILFAATDWDSALRQGNAIATDRGLVGFKDSLEATRRIQVLDEHMVTREPYEAVLAHKTTEIQSIFGKISNLATAAERRSVLDAHAALREIETAVASVRETMGGVYVVEGF